MGCRAGPRTNWALGRAQCGWVLRLGTRAIECAIMAAARLLTLPVGHPALTMVEAVSRCWATTWVGVVDVLRKRAGVGTSFEEFEPVAGCLEKARNDPAVRKAILRRYRWEVSRPALNLYDRESYMKAATKELPAFDMPFTHFQPLPSRTATELLCCEWGPLSWRYYRVWALGRMTGRWPLPVLGDAEMPAVLQYCAACGACDVDVCHSLLACPGTDAFMTALVEAVGPVYRESKAIFLTTLFGHAPRPGHRRHHILFVGKAILASVGRRPSDPESNEVGDAGYVDEWRRMDLQGQLALYLDDKCCDDQ